MYIVTRRFQRMIKCIGWTVLILRNAIYIVPNVQKKKSERELRPMAFTEFIFWILEIIRDNETPEEQLKAMEAVFWRPEKKGGWPQKAFDLNAESMLKTIKSENFLSHSKFTK